MSGEIIEKIIYVDVQGMLVNEEVDFINGVCMKIQVILVILRILVENYEYLNNIFEFLYVR